MKILKEQKIIFPVEQLKKIFSASCGRVRKNIFFNRPVSRNTTFFYFGLKIKSRIFLEILIYWEYQSTFKEQVCQVWNWNKVFWVAYLCYERPWRFAHFWWIFGRWYVVKMSEIWFFSTKGWFYTEIHHWSKFEPNWTIF